MSEKVTPGSLPPGEDLEALFDRFRHICEALEQEQPLEESLKLYAQGVEVQLRIKAELAKAERHVVQIMDQEGNIEPFVAENTDRMRERNRR